MTIRLFGLTLTITSRSTRERCVVVRGELLDEDELTAAFKVDDGNALWRAVNQLVDTLANNCRVKEWEYVDFPQRVAGYVGGAEHLEQLRDDMQARRGMALEAARRVMRRRTVPEGEDSLSERASG